MDALSDHPILGLPRAEKLAALSEEKRKEFFEAREQLLRLEQIDPLRGGFELPIWKLADQQRKELRETHPDGIIIEVNLGGNRSSKSKRAAKRVIQNCMAKPGSRWWCCDSTEAQSRQNQMRYIWEFLPLEWRNEETGMLRRTKTTKVRYTVAGGFTENSIVLPNASEITFKFYEMNVRNLPGPELDGVWADELIPLDWVQTLVYRLVNRNGILHITFTPEEGWSETIGYLLDGARTLVEADAELLPVFNEDGQQIGCEKVPKIVQCKQENARIIYFHSDDNPFGNPKGMKADLKGKSRDEILMRFYGVCERGAHVAFPKFKDNVHVMSLNRFREIEKEFHGEHYQFVDPCSGRNWFMLWVFCPSPGRWIVYREWPSYGHSGAYVEGVGDPGEWTVHGKADDGQAGPAQRAFGFGLERYKQEIERLEESEQILERWIDGRYSQAATLSREASTTLIEQLDEIGLDFKASVSENRILNARDGSIDMINSALYYDEKTPIGSFSAELGRINEPQLSVVETCPNTIYSLKNWTGKDGQHGASKDPIDCIRMIFLCGVDYCGPESYTWVGGRGNG